jgi:transposase
MTYYVDKTREHANYRFVTAVGVDETSIRKHHQHVSVVVDFAKSQTIFVTEGKDGAILKRFVKDLEATQRTLLR